MNKEIRTERIINIAMRIKRRICLAATSLTIMLMPIMSYAQTLEGAAEKAESSITSKLINMAPWILGIVFGACGIGLIIVGDKGRQGIKEKLGWAIAGAAIVAFGAGIAKDVFGLFSS